jgi:hypothetical protein
VSQPKCEVHAYHRPQPLRVDVHHIQPRGMGGADVPGNKIRVCPTGHFNIHRLMGSLLKGLPMPRTGTKAERKLAQRGYDEWVDADKPGRPVYEVW